MRITISLPDDLYAEAKELAGTRPVREIATEAFRLWVAALRRERLADELEAGYRAEADSPSLAAEWAVVEAGAIEEF